jgi:hypothetical protein
VSRYFFETGLVEQSENGLNKIKVYNCSHKISKIVIIIGYLKLLELLEILNCEMYLEIENEKSTKNY